MTWIGATKALLEGEWTDTAGKPLTYFNWNEEKRNEITGSDRNCAMTNFRDNGKWVDIQCDRSYNYCQACQKGKFIH